MTNKTFELEIGGKKMIAEFTDLAEQAHGSVILRYGNTAVLATAVMSTKERNDIDYFPLSVDYEERFYAAGAILGSRFQRREGRPSEEAILSGRVVDRTIRPLFDGRTRREVQVVVTVLAVEDDSPDMLAVNAASLALATSDIPWNGPVSAVRIGQIGAGDFVVNPAHSTRFTQETKLDLLACGRDNTINMIEVGSKEISEDEVTNALVLATLEHAKLQMWQEGIVKEIGKAKREIALAEVPAELTALFESEFAQKVVGAVISGTPGKDTIYALKKEFSAKVAETLPDLKASVAERFLEEKVDHCIHDEAVSKNRRADGRAMDEVRPLYAQAGRVSDMIHGTGIFYRGGTHVFSALTLGGPGDSQIVDGMEEQQVHKRFMHHYNFPPYSSGETGRMGGLNRRMIGHGALAEKALLAVIPDATAFPYTIRLVSECFASNGSTSMGSVCASTLALLDGGVPIKAPVAGIAMGLMMESPSSYKVLTDIQGPEDEHGDMDFKVAGTRNGITAIQMDIKVDGVPVPILTEALEGAKKARLHILETIEKELPAPRAHISPRAPEIISLSVKPDQIGMVIGSGGKVINGIKEVTKVSDITIEDTGAIFITGKNGTPALARAMIEDLVREYKAGEVYEGEVTRLMDFGAFVKIGSGKNAEGLVHVSEIASFRINKVSDAIAVGEKVRVMIKEIDDKGRINLSIKAVDPDFASRKGLTA